MSKKAIKTIESIMLSESKEHKCVKELGIRIAKETVLILDGDETRTVKNALLTQMEINNMADNSNEEIHSVLNKMKNQKNVFIKQDEMEV